MTQLILHVGWSKTGTSAVQCQLDQSFEQLKKKGILYSKKLQMNDHAHHHFALAFNGIRGYQNLYNGQQAMDVLEQEMKEHGCGDALISSELSPFYFQNPKFAEWAKRFDKVRVVFTIRRQSDLLVSLFNQLLKDPQVRYKGSFFELALNNLHHLNFFQQIQRWAKLVGQENINIVNYDDGCVEGVLKLFELSACEQNTAEIVNPSIPKNALLNVKEVNAKVEDVEQYRQNVAKVLSDVKSRCDTGEKPERIFLYGSELAAIDNFFKGSNKRLANTYFARSQLFQPAKYRDILCY